MGPSGSCSPHVEHVFDRPEVEAPRGVEPTGTNGRRRHSIPFPLVCGGGSASLLLRDCWRQGALFLWSRNGVRVRCPVPGPSRHAPVAARGWFSFWPVGVPCFLGVRAVDGGFCGGHGPGVTPGPFPNPEAKAWHGDGTAPGRVWESNTPPQTFVQAGYPLGPRLFCICFLLFSRRRITSDNSCNLTVVLSFFPCHNLRMGNSM